MSLSLPWEYDYVLYTGVPYKPDCVYLNFRGSMQLDLPVVVAGREHGDRERPPPPLQQRVEVLHEGVAAVGGERDGLVAVERLGAADVVVENPVLLAPGWQFNRMKKLPRKWVQVSLAVRCGAVF